MAMRLLKEAKVSLDNCDDKELILTEDDISSMIVAMLTNSTTILTSVLLMKFKTTA